MALATPQDRKSFRNMFCFSITLAIATFTVIYWCLNPSTNIQTQTVPQDQIIGFRLRTVIVDDTGISDIILKPGEHWTFHVPYSGYAPISVDVFGPSVRVFQSIEGREATELPNMFGARQFLMNHKGRAKYTVWPRDHSTPPIIIDANYNPRPDDPAFWSCQPIPQTGKES